MSKEEHQPSEAEAKRTRNASPAVEHVRIAQALEQAAARARELDGCWPMSQPQAAFGGVNAGRPGNTTAPEIDSTVEAGLGIDVASAPFLLDDDVAYAKFLHMRERTERAGEGARRDFVGYPASSEYSAHTQPPMRTEAGAEGILSATSKRPRPGSPCDALGRARTQGEVQEGSRRENPSKRARSDWPGRKDL